MQKPRQIHFLNIICFPWCRHNSLSSIGRTLNSLYPQGLLRKGTFVPHVAQAKCTLAQVPLGLLCRWHCIAFLPNTVLVPFFFVELVQLTEIAEPLSR